MNEAYEALRQARDMIAKPDRHCTGKTACDALGRKVEPRSEDAVAWCVFGALSTCTNLNSPAFIKALEAVNREATIELLGDTGRERGKPMALRANDLLSHSGFMTVLDMALSNLEKKA